MKRIGAFILFLIAFTILVLLGIWQLKRLSWKQEIINQLEMEYQRSYTEGGLSYDDLIPDSGKLFLKSPSPKDGKIVSGIITPLQLKSGGTVLIHRGWIPLEQKEQDITNTGVVTLTGIARKPEWNSFTPNNNPANNIWSKLDIQEIATAKKIKNVAPVIFYAQSSNVKTYPIIQHQTNWFPRNKHKDYAIFWFTMALALIGVFSIYYWKNRKV